jgi:hypothetical protein
MARSAGWRWQPIAKANRKVTWSIVAYLTLKRDGDAFEPARIDQALANCWRDRARRSWMSGGMLGLPPLDNVPIQFGGHDAPSDSPSARGRDGYNRVVDNRSLRNGFHPDYADAKSSARTCSGARACTGARTHDSGHSRDGLEHCWEADRRRAGHGDRRTERRAIGNNECER